MKNLKTTICLAISLVMTIALVQAKNSNNKVTLPISKENSIINISPTNRVFYELMYKINHHKCLEMSINSLSIKNKYSFTSYGRISLVKKDAYTLKGVRSVRTEFSDRKNFSGTPTQESIEIYTGRTGNAVGVKIKMNTWGNKIIVLRNVTIKKEPHGYFITGRVTDGNRTVYYTLGIYEVVCLI